MTSSLETRTLKITLAGKERLLHYNFRAMHALGMKGPADSEGLQKAISEAAGDFGAAARLVHAGLLHEKGDDTEESVREAMMDAWDVRQLVAVYEHLGCIYETKNGAERPTGEGGEHSSSPSPIGESPVPSVVMTSH